MTPTQSTKAPCAVLAEISGIWGRSCVVIGRFLTSHFLAFTDLNARGCNCFFCNLPSWVDPYYEPLSFNSLHIIKEMP